MRKFLDILSGTPEETVSEAAQPVGGTLHRYLETLAEGYTGDVIGGVDVNDFIHGYIACMLWSSNDDNGDPLDKTYNEGDIAPDAMERIKADCSSFLHRCAPWITEARFKGAKITSVAARAGHDFWLTRSGHGAGFWDGDWDGEEHGHEGTLTKASQSYGNIDPYLGDDQKIHLM